MITFITVLQILACLILVTSVLLQQPKGGGTVFGGTSQSVFGSSGGTTFMFRLTMWSAIFIMVSSLFLAWYRNNEARNTVVDFASPTATPPTTVPAAPVPESSVPVKTEGTTPVAPQSPVNTNPPAANQKAK